MLASRAKDATTHTHDEPRRRAIAENAHKLVARAQQAKFAESHVEGRAAQRAVVVAHGNYVERASQRRLVEVKRRRDEGADGAEKVRVFKSLGLPRRRGSRWPLHRRVAAPIGGALGNWCGRGLGHGGRGHKHVRRRGRERGGRRGFVCMARCVGPGRWRRQEAPGPRPEARTAAARCVGHRSISGKGTATQMEAPAPPPAAREPRATTARSRRAVPRPERQRRDCSRIGTPRPSLSHRDRVRPASCAIESPQLNTSARRKVGTVRTCAPTRPRPALIQGLQCSGKV